jgi:hypothetical protein
MPFTDTPTLMFPNVTNGTNTLIFNTATHASPSLPELTTAEADVATGDSRKIAYALMEQIYDWWVSTASADRPTMMTVSKSTQQISNSSQTRTTYAIQFTTDITAEVGDEPA